MTRLAAAFVVVFTLAAGAAHAQQAAEVVPATKAKNTVELTPEMHRYLVDLQRQSAPVELHRQRAQLKAQQRGERLAALKWYGMSNSRPTAGVTPFVGMQYSPRWLGNTWAGDWTDRAHYRTIYLSAQPEDNVAR
jgi:hypothetical protein